MSAAARSGSRLSSTTTGIVWFKPSDLRLRDHAPLWNAHRMHDKVVHVFCFDPRWFGHKFGIPKWGIHKIRFLIESVENLRQNLRNRGSDLFVRQQKPEIFITDIAKELNASIVHTHQETCSEELDVVSAVKSSLQEASLETEFQQWWGNTLYHINDLPWTWNGGMKEISNTYTGFRKTVETNCTVLQPYEIPELWKPDVSADISKLDCGTIPEKHDLFIEPPYKVGGESISSMYGQSIDSRGALHFRGGEDNGLERLSDYIWRNESIATYKVTRNNLEGKHCSSKFSPWLAFGCLSPRTIFQAVKEYEKKRIKNKSTYWLIFELIWRDFFRFSSIKWGNSMFKLHGPRKALGQHIPHRTWGRDEKLIRAWCQGMTGFPIVDASMRELGHTGFMSNRGRQVVASFFVKDLEQDWRIGAAWFESMLVDHDPTSNYGNWTYQAGVGADPRENRYFLVPKQSAKFDKNGEYIKRWVPEVASVSLSEVHNPPYERPVNPSSYVLPIVKLLAHRNPKSNFKASTKLPVASGTKMGREEETSDGMHRTRSARSSRDGKVQHLITDFGCRY